MNCQKAEKISKHHFAAMVPIPGFSVHKLYHISDNSSML